MSRVFLYRSSLNRCANVLETHAVAGGRCLFLAPLLSWVVVALGIQALVCVARPAPPEKFSFRTPHLEDFKSVEVPRSTVGKQTSGRDLETASESSPPWLILRSERTGRTVHFGSRVLIRTESPEGLNRLLDQEEAPLHRRPDPRTAVLQYPSPRHAAVAAQRWAAQPDVRIALPLRRSSGRLHAAWAPAPEDPFFDEQYYLDASGSVLGAGPVEVDMNLRGAWAWSSGNGVLLAVGDNGVDLDHPDLAPNLVDAWHHNFFQRTQDGRHMGRSQYHGTAVAGIAAARADNQIGIAGTAPQAGIASWVLFNRSEELPDASDLADAFEYGLDAVSVQNHSWGNADFDFLEILDIEQAAIDRALTLGRDGLGHVLVRSAGNTRFRNYRNQPGVGDVNLDGFANHPGAIVVAAVRRDGQVASYSTPGDCVLVAAPGGEYSDGLFTLDPVGDAGRSNALNAGESLQDYLPASLSPPGTSLATPLISGIVALLLEVHPQLTWQDIQVLLALSGRQYDLNDPDLKPNGAGLWYSRNTGFGVPDAGLAVRLAREFKTREPMEKRQTMRWSREVEQPLPHTNLSLWVAIPDSQEAPLQLPVRASAGPLPAGSTPMVGLVPLDSTTLPEPLLLDGKAALIDRNDNEDIRAQVHQLATAGAAFALFSRDTASDYREFLHRTDLAPIPTVSLSGNDRAHLLNLLQLHPEARVQLQLTSQDHTFSVEPGFIVESAQVRLQMTHPRMSDLFIVLTSPTGTRSLLHRPHTLHVTQLEDWIYGSKRHLLESGQGDWTVSISDTGTLGTGYVNNVELILHGRPIQDHNGNGLEDGWEDLYFGETEVRADADINEDGWSVAAAQFLGLNPVEGPAPPRIEWHAADASRIRLSWETRPGRLDTLHRGITLSTPLALTEPVTTPGREGVYFINMDLAEGYFQVEPGGETDFDAMAFSDYER